MADEKTRSAETAKESVMDIISERDQAVEEISTIEKAFGDLHGRFEKSKEIIDKFKQVRFRLSYALLSPIRLDLIIFASLMMI